MVSGTTDKYYFLEGTAGVIEDKFYEPSRIFTSMIDNFTKSNPNTFEKIIKFAGAFLFCVGVVYPSRGIATLIDRIARTKIDPAVYAQQEAQWNKYIIMVDRFETRDQVINDLIRAKIKPPINHCPVIWINFRDGDTFQIMNHTLDPIKKAPRKFLVIGKPEKAGLHISDRVRLRDFKNLLFESPFNSIPDMKDKCDTLWISRVGLLSFSERERLRDAIEVLNQ